MGVTDFVSEILRVKNTFPDFKKSTLVARYAFNDC